MMSIGVVSSGSNVHKYFIDKDNYYLTDKSELKEAATWYGKGAEALGIKGQQVDEKLFLDLLEGRMPDGSQIGMMKDGSIKHRPATDITFSAPKSVSLMALVAGDTRLVEAHNHAVKTALDKIESMYAEARYTENRITTYEKTDNLTIATFRHTTSRELDAQLHTHGVVINATQREDGQWRALSSRHKADIENLEHGFRENIYANQHYLGMVYTSELAKAVKESGYDIRIKDKHGNFEIVGLPQEYIDSQSKRRQQVLFSLQEKGLSGAKAAQVAALNSRNIKQETELDVIREYWIKDSKKQDVQLGEVYLNSLKNLDAKTQGNTQTSDSMPAFSQNAKEAINDSLAHLSQYDVQIRHGDIIRQAFIFGAGAIDHEQLESVLSDKLKSGEIIGKADYYYTTKALIDTEKRLTDKFEQSKGAGFSVDTKQSGLVENVLKHHDRLQVIDVKGFKNEAKLLDRLVKSSEANGLNTYVVHQNQSRLNRLDGQVERDNSSFWKAISNHFKHDLMTTTGKFLHDYENKLNQGSFFSNFGRDKQDLVIITDAQKLSYRDGEQIEALTRAGKAKVVFLNNTESTKGFQAGNFVKLLKDSGVENYKSTTAKKDTLVNVAASKEIYQDLAKTFVEHNYNLHNTNKSINSKNDTVTAVTYTNKSQVEATRHIRDELQKQGGLSLQEIAFDTISTKGLSDIEKTKLKCYQIGDLVTLKSKEDSSKNGNNKAFQSYFVTGFDKDNNQLLLKKVINFKAQHNKSGLLQSFVASIAGHNGSKQGGDVFAFNPTDANTAKGEDGKAVDFEVRKKQTLNISVGEQLRTTRNLYLDAKDEIKASQSSSIFATSDNQSTKIEKNSMFTVTDIHQDKITIAHGDKQFSLSKDKLKQSFVDYGYVVKPHQLTKDVDHVLTGLSGYQVNQNSIGEVAEYAKKVTLFTDNPDKSIKALDKESINWIAQEVAAGQVDHTYNPVVRTEKAIRKDLEVVAKALAEKSNVVNGITAQDEKSKVIETAVAYGIAKVAEREAGFSRNELIKSAMFFAVGSASSQDIEQIVAEKEQKGEILVSTGGNLMTTPYVYALEKGIIDNVAQGKDKIAPIFTVSPVIDDKLGLKQGQKDAVCLSLTTTDQFIGINGVAGSGKTTMMKTLKNLAESKGYHLVGIAPTHKAVQELDGSMNKDINSQRLQQNQAKHGTNRLEQAGIPVMTAHKFVGQDMKQYNDKTIFVIDEVSMIGNRLYKDIQDKIISLNSRGIMTGDIGQQVSIEHGKPQELAINNGMKCAYMKEIVRQDNDIMKKTAEYASQKESAQSLRNLENLNPQDHVQRDSTYRNINFEAGNYFEASNRIKKDIDFKSITNSFIEIGIDTENIVDENGRARKQQIWEGGLPSTQNLFDAVANDYLSREKSHRDQTIVVACMHEFRDSIDARIREGLKQEGEIQQEVSTQRLMSKNLDQVDYLHIKNYEIGDVIRFDRTYSIAKKGDHMHVVGMNEQENKLEVLNKVDGNTYTINPAKYAFKSDMTVFKELDAQLGKVDRIRLRMSDETKGWIGGAEYTVKDISDTKALLSNDKGTILLNLKDKKEQLWDYAYTHTSYSAQGATSKHVIGVELNDNYRSNYITVTRAKTHTVIYTLDKNWLIKHLTNAKKMENADKVSAYEVMNKVTVNQEKQINVQQIREVKAKLKAENEANKDNEIKKDSKIKDQKYQQEKHKTEFITREKPVLAEDLKPLLVNRIEDLALTLMGEPNKTFSNAKQLRYGSNGSFVINKETGTWFSHETQEKGDVFKLIQQEARLVDFKSVLEYAKNFTGFTPEMITEAKAKIIKDHTKIDLAEQQKKDSMYQYAKSLYDKSLPLKGTPAEKYLKDQRGLNNYDHANLRFLPKVTAYDEATGNKINVPALLSFAKDEQGKFNHIQVVRLNGDGTKNKDVKINKQTYAEIKGNAIELNTQAINNGNSKKLTYLAEGVETGLSILNVKRDAHVMAVLSVSNFKKVNLNSVADKVIVCLDNDFKSDKVFSDKKALEQHTKSMSIRSKQLNELSQHFRSHGKDVRFILPDKDKYDFNDVLTKQGFTELSKQISQLITEQDYQKITDKYVEHKSKGAVVDMDKVIQSVKGEQYKLQQSIKDVINSQDSTSLKSLNKTKDDLIKLQNIDKENSRVNNINQINGIYKVEDDINIDTQKLTEIARNNKLNDQRLAQHVKHDQVENIPQNTPSTRNNTQEKGFER